MPLHPSFFARSTLQVAPEVLGKYLVRGEHAYMITEVEAYVGPHDKACHAYKGRTARTEVMFGPAGQWYVYLIYGMYHMLNIVTDAENYPAAVLIRGVEDISGPGRLTKRLSITREFNGKPALSDSGLWIEDRGVVVPKKHILRTPRIGIDYAEEWKDKPYRFVLREEKSNREKEKNEREN